MLIWQKEILKMQKDNQNFTKKMTSHLKFVQNYEKYWQKWLSVEEEDQFMHF